MFYKYVMHLFLDESGDMVVIIKGPGWIAVCNKTRQEPLVLPQLYSRVE